MEKIIFVYNANSGWHNSVLDSLHKVVSPNTYTCNLCDITYGLFFENEVWKKFREESKTEMEFLHKDEFIKLYSSYNENSMEYPVVLKKVKGVVSLLINANEIKELKDAKDLMYLLSVKINI